MELSGPEETLALLSELSPALITVLESAADLQARIPDTVLVGGSAAAMYAGHRASYDHDHVLKDLRDRHEAILDALDADPKWVLNRSVPGKIILGELGDIETGLRQLIRKVPLEVNQVELPSGKILTVPTEAETLRVKAYLIVKRNQVRDYLDVAALAYRYSTDFAADALVNIDRYYSDPRKDGTPVADQLILQLSAPQPKDHKIIKQLPKYKDIARKWHKWSTVEAVTKEVATKMLEKSL